MAGPVVARVAILAMVLAALVLVVVAAFVVPAAFACSSEERAVYEEFEQYVGYVEPSGDPGTSSCVAYYETEDPVEDVFAYFEERFEENGWEQRPEEATQVLDEGGELVPVELVAYRPDGFRYSVLVEGLGRPGAGGGAADGLSEEESGARVISRVSEDR